MSEWLRRWTRNPLGAAREGSNPFGVDISEISSSGKISFKNLKRVAKELGERMTDEELQEMIDEADRDGDGEINEEEFLRIMKKTSLY